MADTRKGTKTFNELFCPALFKIGGANKYGSQGINALARTTACPSLGLEVYFASRYQVVATPMLCQFM